MFYMRLYLAFAFKIEVLLKAGFTIWPFWKLAKAPVLPVFRARFFAQGNLIFT